MSIATYGELQTAVGNWLGRSSLTSRIPEFIALAEDRIGLDTRIRVRAMETTTDLTVDAAEVALPTGYLGARRLYIDGDPKHDLEFMTPDVFHRIYAGSETGQPDVFTIEGENLVFGPAPDSTYTGKFLYWQKFTAFSADADTNWLLTNARGLYLYGALLEASPYLGDDPRTLVWAAMYEEVADRLKEADQKDRFSGDTLVVRSDVTRDRRKLPLRYR